jgi:hypothetical protein
MRVRVLTSFVVTAGLSLALGSCGSKAKAPVAESADPLKADSYALVIKGAEAAGGVASFTEPTVIENGVGIHALGRGNRLIISIRNKTPRALSVLPRDFAVILGPKREDLLVLNPAVAEVSGFSAEVEPGDRTVLDLTLKVPAELPGRRLVFNNPREKIQFFIVID